MARLTLKRARQALEAFGQVWLQQAQFLVDGVVLKKISGRLHESFHLEPPPPGANFSNMTIKLTNPATDPTTDFPYAAYHEYFSGHAFMRPALLDIMDKRGGPMVQLTGAVRTDALETLMKSMYEAGWTPGRSPLSAQRTVTIDMGGGIATEAGGYTAAYRASRALGQGQTFNF